MTEQEKAILIVGCLLIGFAISTSLSAKVCAVGICLIVASLAAGIAQFVGYSFNLIRKRGES